MDNDEKDMTNEKVESEVNQQDIQIEELIKKIDDKIEELDRDDEQKQQLLNKTGDLTKEEQVTLGKLLLGYDTENTQYQIIDLSEKNPGLEAMYVCIKERGGNAIIVNSKKEYLGATSAVNFDRHVQEFINGRRTK